MYLSSLSTTLIVKSHTSYLMAMTTGMTPGCPDGVGTVSAPSRSRQASTRSVVRLHLPRRPVGTMVDFRISPSTTGAARRRRITWPLEYHHHGC